MPYTSSSSVLSDFDTGGWAPACEVMTSVLIEWPCRTVRGAGRRGIRATHLSLRTECRTTNREDAWAIKIRGEYFDPPIVDGRGEPLRSFLRVEFDRVPVRFFQFGKRERRHLSAKRLSEIVAGSEKDAGPELWSLLQRDGVRDAFLQACPRLLLESARHVLTRSVMES